MNLKLRILNNHYQSTLTQLEINDLVNLVSNASNGNLALNVDFLNTNFQTIPYSVLGSALADSENPNGLANVVGITFEWLRQVASAFAPGFDVMSFWVEDEDWKGTINGVANMDASILPATCQCHEQELTEALDLQSTGHYYASFLAMHELGHNICQILQMKDNVHAFLTGGNLGGFFAPSNVDYVALEKALVALRQIQSPPLPIVYPVPANFPDWKTDTFTPDARAAIIANQSGQKNAIFEGELVIADPNFKFS